MTLRKTDGIRLLSSLPGDAEQVSGTIPHFAGCFSLGYLWLVLNSCTVSCFPKHLCITDSLSASSPPAQVLALPPGVSSYMLRDFRLKSKYLLKSNKIRKANMKKKSNEYHNDFQIFKVGDHLL